MGLDPGDRYVEIIFLGGKNSIAKEFVLFTNALMRLIKLHPKLIPDFIFETGYFHVLHKLIELTFLTP